MMSREEKNSGLVEEVVEQNQPSEEVKYLERKVNDLTMQLNDKEATIKMFQDALITNDARWEKTIANLVRELFGPKGK